MTGVTLALDAVGAERELVLEMPGGASLSLVFPAAVWRDQLAALVAQTALLDARTDERAEQMSHAARASRR